MFGVWSSMREKPAENPSPEIKGTKRTDPVVRSKYPAEGGQTCIAGSFRGGKIVEQLSGHL